MTEQYYENENNNENRLHRNDTAVTATAMMKPAANASITTQDVMSRDREIMCLQFSESSLRGTRPKAGGGGGGRRKTSAQSAGG